VRTGQGGLPDPADGENEGGGSQVNLLFIGHGANGTIGFSHYFFEFVIDASKLPTELLNILRPLKVADGNTAGIGQNVRNNDDAAFE